MSLTMLLEHAEENGIIVFFKPIFLTKQGDEEHLKNLKELLEAEALDD
jgi:hypothetical protein